MHIHQSVCIDKSAGRLKVEIGIASNWNIINKLCVFIRKRRLEVDRDAGKPLGNNFLVSPFVWIGQHFYEIRVLQKF